MSSVETSSFYHSSCCKKIISETVGLLGLVSLAGIIVALIGLLAPSNGACYGIVQLGQTDHIMLLVGSTILCILVILRTREDDKKRQLASLSVQPDPPEVLSYEPCIPLNLDPMSLPQEVVGLMLSYLDPNYLDACSKVNGWETIANTPHIWKAIDIETLSPSLNIFDEAVWRSALCSQGFGLNTWNLSVDGLRPIDKRSTFPTISRLISSFPVEGKLGFTLFTMPQGLTLNKVVQLARFHNLGLQFPISETIFAEFGDIPIEQPYRILITNSIHAKSRNLYTKDQVNLLGRFGCRMPSVLEVFALIVMTHMKSKKFLYPRKGEKLGEMTHSLNEMTYTRCHERYLQHGVIIGNIGASKIALNFNHDIDFPFIGSGAVWDIPNS